MSTSEKKRLALQRPLMEHGNGPRLELQRDLVTHGPQCWKWGQHHYDCARKKLEDLETIKHCSTNDCCNCSEKCQGVC